MTARAGRSRWRDPIWSMVAPAMISLAACSSVKGTSSTSSLTPTVSPSSLRMTDSIDTQNSSSLAPAAVLDQGGIIAWSGDGKTFALTGSQIPGPPKISLYTYGQGTLAETGTISSEASALSLAFSPDGRTCVFRDPEGMLQTWDLAGGEPVQTDSMVFGFPAGVPGGFVFGPEG